MRGVKPGNDTTSNPSLSKVNRKSSKRKLMRPTDICASAASSTSRAGDIGAWRA